jgi:uncharacterized protein (DUF1778 family)
MERDRPPMREIQLWFSDQEMAAIEAAAARESLSVNDFLVKAAEERVAGDRKMREIAERRRGDVS